MSNHDLGRIGEDRAYGVRQRLRQLARLRERQWGRQERSRGIRHAMTGILVRTRRPTGKWWNDMSLLVPQIEEYTHPAAATRRSWV